MRAKIVLDSAVKPSLKSVTGFIYYIIGLSDKVYAKDLHDNGTIYKKANKYGKVENKKVKPFVFSHPYYNDLGECCIKVSSLDPKFLLNFVRGIQKATNTPSVAGDIKPKSIKLLPDAAVKFNENGIMNREMFMLSPVVVKGHDGSYIDKYDGLEERLKNNLRDKYAAVKGAMPNNDFFKIDFKDKECKYKRIDDKDVPVFLTRFTLSASQEMFEAAYFLGLGAKNGMGFGMVEIHNN
ncbi:MAG: CRISPR-associated endoribonuclease Cas6 [Deltaproteobacteria bacterium]|nr:CRISPR-associated endoribonuclease Cas6 [Deltaproteobacteria bacterium]